MKGIVLKMCIALVALAFLASSFASVALAGSGAGDAASQGYGDRTSVEIRSSAELAGLEGTIDPSLAAKISTEPGPFRVYVVLSSRTAANTLLESMGLSQIRGAEFAGIPTVRLMDLSAPAVVALADCPGVLKLMAYEAPMTEPARTELAKETIQASQLPSVEDYDVDVVHGAVDAWSKGFTGEGIKLAVIDDGFDMAHPDLQGQQARYESGTYTGWPIAYDDYAAGRWAEGKIGGWLADTTATATIKGKRGSSLLFDGQKYSIRNIADSEGSRVRSQSGVYHIGYHPDALLASIWGGPIAVLVVDANEAGVYDTVYVDVTRDFDFGNDKPCTKGDEISYFDSYDSLTGLTQFDSWYGGDGFADYSGGMVYWIADGVNVYPASDWTYGAEFVAGSGEAVGFMGAIGGSHGTMTSSSAIANGVTMGGQLGGMAPGARLITIPFTGSTVNAWMFAQYGVDGMPMTGDEADLVSNSYGWSDTAVSAGYELLDMIAVKISTSGPTMWFWSAGNGGPGYGTVHSVTDFTSVHVGAGTTMQYRYWLGYEVAPGYQKWGDIAPFSNSGPGRNGKLNAEIIASGMYSLEPCPLNMANELGTMGDGSMHFQVGSGTSHATPTAAGGAALGFQAYFETNGMMPAKDYAKAVLMAAADDMKHDPFKQGTGWLNASTYVDAMSGTEGVVSISSGEGSDTSALYPGGVYGESYEMFPNFLLPGESDDSLSVTTYNYGDSAKTVTVSSELLLRSGSESFTARSKGMNDIFIDITDYVPVSTDLLKVTMYTPIEQFDPELDSVANLEYWLELHDWVDLNGNGHMDVKGGQWEIFRYIVDGEQCNYNTAMIKDPIERTTDGLILRIRAYTPVPGTTFNVQLDFYELSEFPWAKVRELGSSGPYASSMALEVPALSQKSWQVEVSVPADAPVGSYAGAIYVDDGSRIQCIPVVIHVPASSYEFTFGGESYFDTPYNNAVVGLSDKWWRFEVGDWRIYWSLPTELPDPNAYLMAGVEWTELPTDINVHVLAPVAVDPENEWMTVFEEFGPGYYEDAIASSDERYMGAGIFGYYTNTGEAKEVIAAPLGEYENVLGTPAPFAVLTRCPLMSGHAPYDVPEGFTKWVVMNGYGADVQSVDISLSAGDPLSGTISAWFDISVDGMIEVRGGGESPMISQSWPNEPIYQDALSSDFVADLANAPYTKAITVVNSDKLTVSVAEVSDAPDIDMGVWYDANMDGIADLTEPYWYVGAGGSSESLTLINPADGQYLVKVLGYTVSGEPGYFSLTVLQSVAGAYVNAVLADDVVGSGMYEFEIEYVMPAVEGVYVGAGTFGFLGTDNMFRIEITFTVTV